MKSNILAVLLCFFSFSIAAQDKVNNFFAIKIKMTHEGEYDQDTWEKATGVIKSLIEFQNAHDDPTNAEYFREGLAQTAEAVKKVVDICKNDESFHLHITTTDTDESSERTSCNKVGTLEIFISFTIGDATSLDNQEKIRTLMSEYAAICDSHNTEVALCNLNDTLQGIFALLSGQARNIVSMW